MPKRVPAIAFVFACALFSLPAVLSQSQAPTTTTTEDAKLRERAMKLHREAIVIDTHNDITSPITDQGFDLGARDTSGKTQTDIPRMKEADSTPNSSRSMSRLNTPKKAGPLV